MFILPLLKRQKRLCSKVREQDFYGDEKRDLRSRQDAVSTNTKKGGEGLNKPNRTLGMMVGTLGEAVIV